MPLSAGAKVGRYEIVEPLGAGGMGEVWRARDPRLGRDVAVKVLREDGFRDADRIARFHAEARAASALNHPNIVAVYDIGEEDGRTYLAMELLEGSSLREILDAGPPPLSKALSIAAQIAEGLAAAHARGIVHRDLKPENVIVTTDGVVKILDFGLAKASPLARSGEDQTTSVTPGTTPGVILGTVGYMSPEQAAGGAADHRSDQFSFGTILYELITGRRAWKRATMAESLTAILREDPAPISSGLPLAVRRIVERCLTKDPGDRYHSTRDLAGDVRYLVDHASATGPVRDVPPAAVSPSPPSATRRVSPAALVAVTLLGALAAFLWARNRAGHAVASLAVLPFENRTPGSDSDYLSDGITESLIDRMSRVSSLTVMARATVFRYKGSKDALEAGRKLGVAAVLTGSVTRTPSRLTVSAELVDVRTGARLWGERYERPFADIVRVQDAIALDISDALRLRLTGHERTALVRHGTENPEAYELYLRARHYLWKGTEEGYLEAARFFSQAVEKDPKFAEAYVDMGGVMALEGYVRPAEGWGKMDVTRKALALSPGLPSARLSLADAKFFYEWDWEGAERELRDLFAGPLDPEGIDARPFALLLWSRGRIDEALAVMEKARRKDPGNLAYAVTTADYLVKAGRLDEAAGLYRATSAGDPSDPRALFGLAEVLMKKGDVAGAIDALRGAYDLMGESEGVRALARASTEKDYRNARIAVARSQLADLRALASQRYVSPFDLARLAVQAGEREEAFRYLDEAFAERSGGLVFLKVDSVWDPIRDDPRFASLVKRVGIP